MSEIETIHEAIRYAIFSHTTRRETVYDENNCREIDVHVSEECPRCSFDKALDALAARLEKAEEALREAGAALALTREKVRLGGTEFQLEVISAAEFAVSDALTPADYQADRP